MKSKTEFYETYFAALQKNGFTIKEPSSPDYIVDILHRGKVLAFYGKNDALIKNPFLEVPEKLYERIQALAYSTANTCGICVEKPYEEAAAQKLSNNVMKINEHNGVVLACKQHNLFGYVLSTYRQDAENGNAPIQRQYFYNKEAAFESFAIRSGLIDEKKLFCETELKILHSGLVKLLAVDHDVDQEDFTCAQQIVERIEDIVPELHRQEKLFDFQKILGAIDLGMER